MTMMYINQALPQILNLIERAFTGEVILMTKTEQTIKRGSCYSFGDRFDAEGSKTRFLRGEER